MVMLILTILFDIEFRPFRIHFFPKFFLKVQQFTGNKAYLVITLFFWISLFSIFQSSNYSSWSFFTNMKLPFLLLPFTFFFFPDFSKREYYSLLLVFLFFIFCSSITVLYSVLTNPEILETIKQGQAIPTPIDHIKYSLFISFAIISGLIILLNSGTMLWKYEKYFLGFILIYLVVFIHILAVRSGILILYMNLIVLLLVRTFSKKNYLLGVILLLFIITLPFMAYKAIPSFKEKIHYSILDYKMHKQNKDVAYSDGERFRSYEIGWELFNSSPISGIGVGDIFDEYAALYEQKYFTESPTKLPHNQFLTVATSTGIVGLIFFIIAFFFPITYLQAYKEPVFLSLHVLLLLSFMVENTIERQYSVGFYLVFLLLGLNQVHKNRLKS